MPHSNQGEWLRHVFQEAVRREAQYQARYAFLAGTVREDKLKAMFSEFAAVSGQRVKLLKAEMKHFNPKY